jgi:7-keto-8-aminopelargonate synthetase-like enzyme
MNNNSELVFMQRYGAGEVTGRETAVLVTRICRSTGVADYTDLHAGTFSKAVGTIGGFVAGDKALITFLRFNAPTYLFTKSQPLAVVAATQTALDLVEQADEQREQLWRNSHRLQSGLIECGFDVGQTASPITPVQFEGAEALMYANELRETHCIWAATVLDPAVELGTSLLRLIPTARYTADDIDDPIECMRSI